MRSSLFPYLPIPALWGPPALLGIIYTGLALDCFGNDFQFVCEHLFVLALWVSGTQFAFLTAHKAFSFTRFKLRARVAALIPALSFYFLFILYLSASIGTFYWGSAPTYLIVSRFLLHFSEISRDFSTPPWIPLSLLGISLLGFVLFYQRKANRLETWASVWVADFGRIAPVRKFWTFSVVALSWASGAILFFSANPDLPLWGDFSQDPVKGFFTGQKSGFPMTQERIHWAELDHEAEQKTRPRMPQVHTVILVIVDALRADHLPAYGYSRPTTPFLFGLSRSTHYRKVDLCLANGLESSVGIMSILTSKEEPAISHLNYTFPDFLTENGYQDLLYLSGDHHWYNFKNSYGRKIGFFLDGSLFPPGYSIDDDEALPVVLKKLKPDDGKFHFFYFHLMSVHESGTLHDPYLQYQPARNFIAPDFRTHSQTPNEVIQTAVNMYDDRILQCDAILKDLWGILGQKGYLKDYVMVITADHGELLGEDNHYGHAHFTNPGILHTPLLFFASRPLPRFAQNRFATALDIAPTLSEIAGLNPPSTWQGQSLLHPRTNPWTYHFTPSLRSGDQGAVVFYDKKSILEYTRPLADLSAHPQDESLVDLLHDPKGLINLVPVTDSTRLNEFRRQALDHFLIR